MKVTRFRAWHKREAKMIDPVVSLNLEEPNPNITWYDSMSDALEGKSSGDFLEEVELMQFTGIYDKNDQPIYEGDILTNGRHKIVVQYNSAYAMFDGKFIDMDREMSPLYSYVRAHGYYLIGNVHEDSDLLKRT